LLLRAAVANRRRISYGIQFFNTLSFQWGSVVVHLTTVSGSNPVRMSVILLVRVELIRSLTS